jgi:hypothetical protein
VATALALVTASAALAQGTNQQDARLVRQSLRAVEQESGAPLAGVDIVDVATGRRAVTSIDGSARISIRRADSASVLARKVGFVPRQVRFALADTVVTIRFQRLTTLEAATVTSEGVSPELVHKLRMVGFLQRRQTTAASASSFITDTDIARLKPFKISDITERLASRRGCITYLDGVRVQPPISSSRGYRQGVDVLVVPTEVAAVEIYRGAAVVPPQFQSMGRTDCVVLYWLK